MKEAAKQNLLCLMCKHASNSICNHLQQLIQAMSLRAKAKQRRRWSILQQIKRASIITTVHKKRVGGSGYTLKD